MDLWSCDGASLGLFLCCLLLRLSLLAFLSRLATVIKLFIDGMGRVEELLIVFRFEFLGGKDDFEVAEMLRFPIAPLA